MKSLTGESLWEAMMADDSDDDSGRFAIVRVTLRDVLTGVERQPDWEQNAYFWSGGSGQCDCNRADWFDDAYSHLTQEQREAHMRGDDCVGTGRFLVVSVEPMPPGYDLGDFNRLYPAELVEKHIGMKARR